MKKSKSSARSKRKSAPFRWPRVVVQHGVCVELQVDKGDGTISRYTWPKTGKKSMFLFTDAAGRRLMIAPYNKIAVTDDDFNERLERAGKLGKDALSQWRESTGKAASVGAVVKVPERTLHRIGRAVSIVYYFDRKHRDGDPREHLFESSASVKADNDFAPGLVVISGGNLEITGAGIEG
jgi:hypothetical protein